MAKMTGKPKFQRYHRIQLIKYSQKYFKKKFFKNYHNAFNFHVSNASLVKTQSKLLIRCLVRMSH